jgi:high-affinity nickel-transport protein
MSAWLRAAFDDRSANVRGKVVAVFGLLAIVNLAAWGWALIAFRHFPVLLGMAAVAYSFGLRHAFDADHIAAIDNVTRKLMQEGRRPVGVDLFFSLGHSTVVIALSIVIALTASGLKDRFDAFKSFGAVAGTIVSALFPFAIAVANLFVLASTWRAFRAARAGAPVTDIDTAFSGGGVMARLFRSVFRTIEASWQMFPIRDYCLPRLRHGDGGWLARYIRDRRGARSADLVDPGISRPVHRRHDIARHCR